MREAVDTVLGALATTGERATCGYDHGEYTERGQQGRRAAACQRQSSCYKDG